MLENLSKEEVSFNIWLLQLPLNDEMKKKVLLGKVVLKAKEKENIILT